SQELVIGNVAFSTVHVIDPYASRRQTLESDQEKSFQALMCRDVFGNPFQPVIFNPSWLSSTVVELARSIYERKAFEEMPTLGHALQNAGCENEAIVGHCRAEGVHVRGCWVIDSLLEKE